MIIVSLQPLEVIAIRAVLAPEETAAESRTK
jgi:hypothetical protein